MLNEDELDEQEDIRLYDKAKAANEASVPIEEAFKLLDEKRWILSQHQSGHSASS